VKSIYKNILLYFYGEEEEAEIEPSEYPKFKNENYPISEETNKSRKTVEYICYALILTTAACLI
jgi:hypothetical protein